MKDFWQQRWRSQICFISTYWLIPLFNLNSLPQNTGMEEYITTYTRRKQQNSLQSYSLKNKYILVRARNWHRLLARNSVTDMLLYPKNYRTLEFLEPMLRGASQTKEYTFEVKCLQLYYAILYDIVLCLQT